MEPPKIAAIRLRAPTAAVAVAGADPATAAEDSFIFLACSPLFRPKEALNRRAAEEGGGDKARDYSLTERQVGTGGMRRRRILSVGRSLVVGGRGPRRSGLQQRDPVAHEDVTDVVLVS